MLNRLDELTKAEDLMTGALARRGIAIVEREQQRQGRMQQAEWYRKWLSVPNSSTNQVTASNARHEDTSMWLVRGQVYEAWKSSGTLLWITGKPGAGKTVICSTVIKALQDSLHFSRSSAFLAYFYCDFRDTTKQSYPALLGSLLMDLSTQSDESENILRELFLKYKNGSQEPEAGDLKQCLKDMLAIPSDDAKYIVVDALDELPNHGVSSSREKTLELMSWLLGLGISGLRLCVTSRPEDDIGQVLKSLASHQVALDEEREHREDIARLIRSIVEKNRKMQGWGGAIKEEVIEALSEKADGMFRYVSCQLDILCEAPISKIRSTLKSLPSTLYTTYESTLGHINREKWEDARRLFQCLSFSTRPLTVEELAEVLAVSVDEEVPTYHDDWRSNDSESVVLSTCPGSFIQVIREDRFSVEAPRRIVQFAHFSVKEFLTSDQLAKSESKTSYFHVLPGLSHVVLAKACLGILLLPNAAASASIQPRLESYATDLWDAHARFEDVSMSLLRAMKLLFDPTKPHFASWAHSREPYQRPPLGNPLYFAALCDLPPIVEHILGSGFHDVNDRGADINASGGLYGSALQGAASNGKLDMVQLLLDRGADVNASGGPYGSALHGAVSNGKLDMVQLLLDRGADINASGGHYGSALQGAAWNGKLDIVLLLLDHGADINVQGGLYGNMLRAAACNWRKEIDIVQFFLDRGFDVNAQGGPFGTALIGASYEGHLDIVRLLLARGADTSIRSERYGTALEATRAGLSWDTTNLREHTAIVELLSNVPQDATYVVPPNGGTGSSTQ
ncbi:hypothetical protein BC834DRAFT_1030488 [Gloeopeniophorella convolvens]|nr:hypothetical protein BC834DRAFT_1030488 [Gloeopeniophorella convolvens]